MKQKKLNSNKIPDLRKKAEKKLKARMPSIETMSDSAIQQLVHELQVHQIELEMQNEELRDTQVELEESRSKYSDLFDFSPVGYLSLDKKGLIHEANLTITDLLGIKREQLIDKPFTIYVEKEDIDYIMSHLKMVHMIRKIYVSQRKATSPLPILNTEKNISDNKEVKKVLVYQH